MPHATMFHHRLRLFERRFGTAAEHLARHDVGDADIGRRTLFGHDSAEHVALGEDPHDPIIVRDDQGADLVLIHHARRFEHADARRDGMQRSLFPIQQVSDHRHDVLPSRCDGGAGPPGGIARGRAQSIDRNGISAWKTGCRR